MDKQKMKDCEKRTRRHIFINDAIYKEVAKEAIERDVDYGAVIDEALKTHFKKRGVLNEQ